MNEKNLLEEALERKDGESIYRLKSGPVIREIIKYHQKNEPAFETVVYLAFLDSTTPMGKRREDPALQALGYGSVVLSSYPDPAEAEEWVRLAEEKQLSCLDKIYRKMAECYGEGANLADSIDASNAATSDEKTQNLFTSAASGDADAAFSLYQLITDGKYQHRKNVLAILSLLTPLVFGLFSLVTLPECIDIVFFGIVFALLRQAWANCPDLGRICHFPRPVLPFRKACSIQFPPAFQHARIAFGLLVLIFVIISITKLVREANISLRKISMRAYAIPMAILFILICVFTIPDIIMQRRTILSSSHDASEEIQNDAYASDADVGRSSIEAGMRAAERWYPEHGI